MKKWIIGSLVGAIIVFAWQAASWMFLGIHNSHMKYTPAQQQAIDALSTALPEDGMYMLPTAPPGTSEKEKQELMKQMEGKPWAMVTYGKSWTNNMTQSMITGFLVDVILVVLLISILVRGGLPSFTGIFTGAVAVGVFSFLWSHYLLHNWYNVSWSSIQPFLIDAIVAWGLCGLWLAWWLRKPVTVKS
ncbi:MAG: hypothetical protein C4308_04125 [Chitinophagaceae bacterium]